MSGAILKWSWRSHFRGTALHVFFYLSYKLDQIINIPRSQSEWEYPVCKHWWNWTLLMTKSLKYNSSLLPDDQISSQSMKHKSHLTSSSTNELFFNTTYFTFLPLSLKNPEPLSYRGDIIGLLSESVLPELQFFWSQINAFVGLLPPRFMAYVTELEQIFQKRYMKPQNIPIASAILR